MNRVCLEQVGETKSYLKQQLRSYSSSYNEIVYRSSIISIDNQGVQSTSPSGIDFDYYTDDSMKSIKRKVFSLNEAIEKRLDFGGERSLHGLNGYPCNKGLILNLNGKNSNANEESSSVTLGFALSHPLLCHILGGYPAADDSSAMNTFEFMLSRSVHNNDLKGLKALRNTESGLSELNLAINMNRRDSKDSHNDFIHSYNLGKEVISGSEKEIIFEKVVPDASAAAKIFMKNIKLFEEDIIDSREVDFMRAQITQNDCVDFTLRNTMSYPVNLETGFSDDSAFQSQLTTTKLSIKDSLESVPSISPKLDFASDPSEQILT